MLSVDFIKTYKTFVFHCFEIKRKVDILLLGFADSSPGSVDRLTVGQGCVFPTDGLARENQRGRS